MRDEPGVELVIHNVPTSLYLAARRHIDRLVAEADEARDHFGAPDRPELEVLAAVAEIVREPPDRRARSTALVEEAHRRGEATTSIPYSVSDPSAIALVARGMDLLVAADRYSRSGALRTPPADPDVLAFYTWFRRALSIALDEAGIDPPG